MRHSGEFELKSLMKSKNAPTLSVSNFGVEYSEQYDISDSFLLFHIVNEPLSDSQTISILSPSYCSSATYCIKSMLRNRTPHNHSFFEIMIVLSGEIEQIIEGQHIIYREGEACILNKSIRHFERGGSMFEALFIDLSDTILEQVLNDASASPCGMGLEDALKGVSHLKRLNEKKKYYNAKEYIDFRPVEDAGGSMRSDILLSHVNDLAMETIDYGVGSSFITTGLISRIMHALGSESLYRQTYMNIADGKEEAILGKAISLMEASCGRISRDELAKELHYNSDYLNRIVKKYTGKPIGELSRFLLLERAKELILSQDSSISQIAQDLGFTNRTYFYRIFEKECHMTPNEYRLRNGSS